MLRFQRKGVYGNFVLIEEFRCFLFPLENDLMSMEMNDCFKVYIIKFIISLFWHTNITLVVFIVNIKFYFCVF